MLVPNEAYAAVGRWVEDHQLKGKFVYFRVPERLAPRQPAPRGPGLWLVDCLEVDAGTPYAPWLRAELDRRAGYACVDVSATLKLASCFNSLSLGSRTMS